MAGRRVEEYCAEVGAVIVARGMGMYVRLRPCVFGFFIVFTGCIMSMPLYLLRPARAVLDCPHHTTRQDRRYSGREEGGGTCDGTWRDCEVPAWRWACYRYCCHFLLDGEIVVRYSGR